MIASGVRLCLELSEGFVFVQVSEAPGRETVLWESGSVTSLPKGQGGVRPVESWWLQGW